MQIKHLLRWAGLTGVMLLSAAASAQLFTTELDWEESAIPPPPAYSADRLIALEMPAYNTMRFGVDPATLKISSDGVVRYVVVATNAAGASSAIYEGLRCKTDEVKTYARASQPGSWTMVKNPQWVSMTGNLPSKHALALSRQGACSSVVTAQSVQEIERRLKLPRSVD